MHESSLKCYNMHDGSYNMPKAVPNDITCMLHDVTYKRALPNDITRMIHDITCRRASRML